MDVTRVIETESTDKPHDPLDLEALLAMEEEERLQYLASLNLDRNQFTGVCGQLAGKLPSDSLSKLLAIAPPMSNQVEKAGIGDSLSRFQNRGMKSSELSKNETQAIENQTQERKGETQERKGETQEREGETQERKGETQEREGETQERKGETQAREDHVAQNNIQTETQAHQVSQTTRADMSNAAQEKQAAQATGQAAQQGQGGGRPKFSLFNFSGRKPKPSEDLPPAVMPLAEANAKHETVDPNSHAPIAGSTHVLDPVGAAFYQADQLRRQGITPENASKDDQLIFEREGAVIKQQRAREINQLHGDMSNSEDRLKKAMANYKGLFSEPLLKKLSKLEGDDNYEARRNLISEAMSAGKIDSKLHQQLGIEAAQAIYQHQKDMLAIGQKMTNKGFGDEAEKLSERFGDTLKQVAKDSYFEESQPKSTKESMQKLIEDMSKQLTEMLKKLLGIKSGEDESVSMGM